MVADPVTRTIEYADAERVRSLCGPAEQHLRMVEQQLGVRIGARGNRLTLGGQPEQVDEAERLLNGLYALVKADYQLYPQDVEQAARLLASEPELDLKDIFFDTVFVTAKGRAVRPKSLAQKRYLDAIRTNDIVFGIGPAGTGKTYLAMAMAVSALTEREVARIILCRPAVEAGEKLGFLPGDLTEKVNPYLRPLHDALRDLLDEQKAAELLEAGVIEVAPLAFMRGRTLSDAFVILDEAQNTTNDQMKMLLTRLGVGSKAVVTGDITQVDLPSSRTSGLIAAQRILTGVEGIEFTHFTEADVVRHTLVRRVIRAYDRASRPEGPGGDGPDDRTP